MPTAFLASEPQDAETRSQPTKNVQSQYERISEWLLTMGAEEAASVLPALHGTCHGTCNCNKLYIYNKL